METEEAPAALCKEMASDHHGVRGGLDLRVLGLVLVGLGVGLAGSSCDDTSQEHPADRGEGPTSATPGGTVCAHVERDREGTREQGLKIEGVREGVWVKWLPSGKIATITDYHHGAPTAAWWWNEAGELVAAGTYLDGHPWRGIFPTEAEAHEPVCRFRDGLQLDACLQDVVDEFHQDLSNRPRSTAHVVNATVGKEPPQDYVGIWRTWFFKPCRKASEMYCAKGKADGIVATWLPNGMISTLEEYRSGVLTRATIWNARGDLVADGQYREAAWEGTILGVLEGKLVVRQYSEGIPGDIDPTGTARANDPEYGMWDGECE